MEPISAADQPATGTFNVTALAERLDTLADGLLAVLDSQDTFKESLTRMETTLSNISGQQGQLDADVQALTESNAALTASNTAMAAEVANIKTYIETLKTQPAAAGLDLGPLEASIAAAQTAATGTGTEVNAAATLAPVVGS